MLDAYSNSCSENALDASIKLDSTKLGHLRNLFSQLHASPSLMELSQLATDSDTQTNMNILGTLLCLGIAYKLHTMWSDPYTYGQSLPFYPFYVPPHPAFAKYGHPSNNNKVARADA